MFKTQLLESFSGPVWMGFMGEKLGRVFGGKRALGGNSVVTQTALLELSSGVRREESRQKVLGTFWRARGGYGSMAFVTVASVVVAERAFVPRKCFGAHVFVNPLGCVVGASV